jgi:hypothetical protein
MTLPRTAEDALAHKIGGLIAKQRGCGILMPGGNHIVCRETRLPKDQRVAGACGCFELAEDILAMTAPATELDRLRTVISLCAGSRTF